MAEKTTAKNLRAIVQSDGQFHWLSIEDDFLRLESIDKCGGQKQKRRPIPSSTTRTKSSSGRRPTKIPLCEILAVKFCDHHRSSSTENSTCVSCQTATRRDRRSLSSREIAAISASLSSIRKLSETKQSIEQESETIAIYFVRRRLENIWRVGELTCHFNVSNEKDPIDCGIFETSPSVTAAEFLRHIRTHISGCPRPKSLLVFINPYGGSKKAVNLYKNHATPIFDLCCISAKVIETQRPLHATEFVADADLSAYDGIIAAGGDGLFNEVLNGLVVRKQRELKIDINDRKAELARPDMTVGLIAAGSTNALAHTVHGTDDPLTSILHIAIGDRRGVDVCGVYDEERFLRFASTAVSYGFLGDLLKESERLRRFGPPRYLMSGVKVWLRNSFYGGIVQYKTRYGSKHDGNAKKLNLNPCRSGCYLCGDNDPTIDRQAITKFETSSAPELASGEEEDLDAMWSIVDDFTHLVCVVTACLCKSAPNGISPVCHLGDGYMHLALISKLGRFQNLAFLGRIMSKNVDHTQQSAFRFFEVKEFTFTPKCFMKPTFTRSSSDVLKTPRYDGSNPVIKVDSPSKVSAEAAKAIRDGRLGGWNIDGELVAQPQGSIYFRVHRQLITIFARGIEATTTP